MNKLKEPSTIRGIIALLGVFGVSISPEHVETILQLVVAGLAVVEIFRKEK